jgi:hypothetical protein
MFDKGIFSFQKKVGGPGSIEKTRLQCCKALFCVSSTKIGTKHSKKNNTLPPQYFAFIFTVLPTH